MLTTSMTQGNLIRNVVLALVLARIIGLLSLKGSQPMRLRQAVMAAIVACSFAASSSQAAIISRTYNFTATNLDPFPDLVGSVSVTFDNSLTYQDETTGITLNNLSISLGSPISFDYFVGIDSIVFGGLHLGTEGVGQNSDDFAVAILHASTSPSFFRAAVASSQAEQLPVTRTGSVNFTSVEAVPEPAALGLFAVGIAGLFCMRRRRTLPAA